MKETLKLYSMAEVVAVLGVNYSRLYHYEYSGELPPAKRVGRNRFYTDNDVKQLKAFFAKKEAT